MYIKIREVIEVYVRTWSKKMVKRQGAIPAIAMHSAQTLTIKHLSFIIINLYLHIFIRKKCCNINI